ncbi:MAG TPA: N-acetylmuramic acid 6-phosphate etherase, partial [Candidatus Hydrogenedentes bacterium]|nr:N-acetylmuramic acid 6-phosphate etherase [Candidatus Hydrogenedentota bacterium]
IADAVAQETENIAAAIEVVSAAVKKGGRLIYVGAGTSGRLGVLDAAECPPTFGVAADAVVALIAGGDAALRISAEGEEDNANSAVADIQFLKPPVGDNDVVAGITASGTTPYVLAALDEAKRRGAPTVLVCCNPTCRGKADVVIAMGTGPEVLPGSTRLKAGTATKMVLNMISTGAMARAGNVYEGLMVGMRPTNAKLRGRAQRIVAVLCNTDETRAAELLRKADGAIAVAVLAEKMGIEPGAARARLDACRGILRDALGNVP